MRDAARLAQYVEKVGTIGRVAAERRVDTSAVSPERAQCRRGHALELGALLQLQETLQDCAGPFDEELVVPDVEQLVDRLEIGVDRLHVHLRREEAGVQVLEHDDIELAYRFRRAVVALHQLLRCAPGRRVREGELARECCLHIEDQPVFAPACEIVQADAEVVDQPLVSRELPRLRRCHQTVRRNLAPGMAEARGASDPENRLQVAAAARAFLKIRLEVVRSVLIAEVALLLLQRLRFVEAAHVERRIEASAEEGIERTRSGEETPLEQAGADDCIAFHLGFTLIDRAHAVADLETGVPHQADETLDARSASGSRIGQRLRQEHDHVDVGVRKELASAVAADGDQRASLWRVDLGPKPAQYAVGELRLPGEQPPRPAIASVRGFEPATAGFELVLPARDRRIRGAAGGGSDDAAQARA